MAAGGPVYPVVGFHMYWLQHVILKSMTNRAHHGYFGFRKHRGKAEALPSPALRSQLESIPAVLVIVTQCYMWHESGVYLGGGYPPAQFMSHTSSGWSLIMQLHFLLPSTRLSFLWFSCLIIIFTVGKILGWMLPAFWLVQGIFDSQKGYAVDCGTHIDKKMYGTRPREEKNWERPLLLPLVQKGWWAHCNWHQGSTFCSLSSNCSPHSPEHRFPRNKNRHSKSGGIICLGHLQHDLSHFGAFTTMY